MIASIYRFPDCSIKKQKRIIIEYDKIIQTYNEKEYAEITFMKDDNLVHSIQFEGEPFRIYLMTDKGVTFDNISFKINDVIN